MAGCRRAGVIGDFLLTRPMLLWALLLATQLSWLVRSWISATVALPV